MDTLLSDAVSIDLVAASRRSDAFPPWSDEKRAQVTRDIDEMWHLHMLHPRAYAADCQRLMGQVMDHHGAGDGADAADVQAAFERTGALWVEAYGSSYAAGGGEGAKCGNCKG